jgi:exonuclease SbcC
MRPQRLTLKNFMPFRSTEGQVQEVDFSTLDLFAITGPMASGKSSLIDAIVWCLYGRTARYGADSKGVISAGETLCEVAFDFTIGSRWFRAVRRTGKTTESGLSEREHGEWIQDVSGSERLTSRLEELLGLDFDSFTKTVILPQGKYAEFLGSEPSKRRDLLEKILELGVYKRVADRAKDLETRAKERAKTIRETLAQPQYAGVTRSVVEQRQGELEAIAQEIVQTAAQEEILRGLAHKAEAVHGITTRLSDLRKEEQTRAAEQEQAQQKHEAAETHLRSLTQALAEVEAEREALGYDTRRHEVVKRASSYLREHLTACQEAEAKTHELAQVQKALADLAQQLDDQAHTLEQARRTYEERAAALQADVASGGDIATLTDKLNEAKRWKELLREQQRLTRQRQTLTQQLTETRQSLAALLTQEKTNEQDLHDLQQQRDRAREEEQQKRQREIEAGHLGKILQEAAREEKRAGQDAVQARNATLAAEQEVQRQREVAARAEQVEQAAAHALEENRKKNEIAHLRATLHADEPCPVCLVPVREILPISSEAQADQAALQRALERARAALTQSRQALQKAEAEAAMARAKKDSTEQELVVRQQKRQEEQDQFVAQFPGFASLKDALTALLTQRQELVVRLKELETKAQTAEKTRRDLTQQREKLQRAEATAGEALRSVAASLETDDSQIAVLAASLAPYRTSGQDPERELLTRRQRLMQAEQEVKALASAVHQAEEGLNLLNQRKLQAEGTAQVLQSEYNAVTAQAQRAAQAVHENLELGSDAPLPSLAIIEEELAELAQKQEQHTAQEHRRESLRKDQSHAEQTLAAAQANLQAREGFLQRSRQAIGQAEDELAQARTTLHDAIQASTIPELNPDGAGIQERLAAAHEHGIALRERRSRLEAEIADFERRCMEKEQEEQKLRESETESRLAADLRKLLGAEFTDYLSEGAVKALMHDASVHLQKLTHNRYSFRIEYKRRAIELLIVDHEDQQRTRPTHSLSGGETFLASLAIALALSQSFRQIATGKAAKTSTECLILDEGFGTLDREGLQLVTETLQELRGEEGRIVGIITHVEEVAAAMPRRIEVRKGSRASTIAVVG